MTKKSPQYLSRNDIEQIAQRVSSAYQKLPAVQKETDGVVHPMLLIRDLLGLSVECHALSPDGSILGLTSCGEVWIPVYDDPANPEYCHLDGKTLLVDRKLAEGTNQGRYHFTLIHEACHQIYRMLFPKAYAWDVAARKIHFCTAQRAMSHGDWEEWRTDTLASAILMPQNMVQDNMRIFGLGDKLRILNRVFAPSEYNRFCEMADHMGVSKQALAIRLKRLGLLERDCLQDPYSLINIFPDDREKVG